jgi:hypothetical protein
LNLEHSPLLLVDLGQMQASLLFIEGTRQGHRGTPADKRIQRGEKRKELEEEASISSIFCLFRCCFSKGDFVNFMLICFLGSGVNSSDGFS